MAATGRPAAAARTIGRMTPPTAAKDAPPGPPSEPVADAIRVLVVDNDATVLEATRQLLAGWGAEVRAAAAPEEALAAAAALSPQVWLLDFHLDDGATGDALHRALVERHPRGVGVIVSADHSEAVRQAVLAAGALAMTKPLKPLRLKTLLQQVARG